MAQEPGYPDLKAPRTRYAQSWAFFWQVYRNNLPRKLDRTNDLLRATRATLKR